MRTHLELEESREPRIVGVVLDIVKQPQLERLVESRRAWKAVADGIRNGDYDAASVAKGTLENSERQDENSP
jgi:hypothetical protein